MKSLAERAFAKSMGGGGESDLPVKEMDLEATGDAVIGKRIRMALESKDDAALAKAVKACVEVAGGYPDGDDEDMDD